MTHGVWCVGSCWALMLLPLLVSHGHVATMAAGGGVVAIHRTFRPADASAGAGAARAGHPHSGRTGQECDRAAVKGVITR
ncbi:DUF2182 domain-containing protein [Mesorhizobium waimense]|uniref:copper chaperone n=1 Tax=Mesorhizobium waimense TaxID=1300307 RepID=UPI00142DE86F